MGEYVLGLMLAFSHRIPKMVEDTRTGTWSEKRFARYLPQELRGSTVGIVGYGAIGREVARLSRAFGMTVLAMKRNLRRLSAANTFTVEGTGDPEGEIPDRYYPPSALHSMLSESDFVVVLTPLTEATHHLIDADALNAMKESAYLINVARGDVVDEGALTEALQEATIAGAGLDVFSEEPLPEESPLWGMENAILSPHIAGNTPEYNDRAVSLFITNLKRFFLGDILLNEVKRSRNY
jgi:phosphoglycerate dehydrogenase-like enzyme